jgi:hypothetical protein
MKGHENKKKYPIPIIDHGEKMVWEKNKCMSLSNCEIVEMI